MTGSPGHTNFNQIFEIMVGFFTLSVNVWVARCFKKFGYHNSIYLGIICFAKALEVLDDRFCIHVRTLYQK